MTLIGSALDFEIDVELDLPIEILRNIDEAKYLVRELRSAVATLSYIKDGMSLGVGTGSTVDILIELLQPLAAKLGVKVIHIAERDTQRHRC